MGQTDGSTTVPPNRGQVLDTITAVLVELGVIETASQLDAVTLWTRATTGEPSQYRVRLQYIAPRT